MKNRGMLLESVINRSIKKFKKDELALMHKKEIPIKFGGVISDGKKIKTNNAYIVSKSTTDYYGIYKGYFLAFEAKSTKKDAIPKANFKVHQHNYLNLVRKHGGLSFYIIYFSTYDEFYLVESKYIDINHSVKRSIIVENGYELTLVYPGYLNILEVIDKII